MSIYGGMMEALITEEEALAPFAFSEETEEKLQQMGVINKQYELNEAAIAVLATTFAVKFNDFFNEFYEADFDALDTAFEAVKSLHNNGELAGAYIYLLICCSMIDCSAPHELKWLARQEDVLSAYIKKFIEAMEQYEICVSEEKTD